MPATRLWRCPTCGVDYQVPVNDPDPLVCQRCAPARRPSPPRPQPTPAAPNPAIARPGMSTGEIVLISLRSVVWGVFLVAAFAVVMDYLNGSKLDQYAPQQAARAGQGCFWMLTLYAIARAFDSALRR